MLEMSKRMVSCKAVPVSILIVASVLNVLLCIGRVPLSLWRHQQQQHELQLLLPNPTSTLLLLRKKEKLEQQQLLRLQQKQNEIENTGAAPQQQPCNSEAAADKDELCRREYRRVTQDRLNGLTQEDLQRALTYRGNRHRLGKLAEKLDKRQEPVTAVTLGGSITLGHGVKQMYRYSNRLATWMNSVYPLHDDAFNHNNSNGDGVKQGKQHKVLNLGCHGANICAMAKRLDMLITELLDDRDSNVDGGGLSPDLFILEFAVNDYEGRDHNFMVGYETDVFFDGFREIATCTEVALYKLLKTFPNAAVIFLEMQTGVLGRKTASVLHAGAALHYQVPVVNYGQAVMPAYEYLIDQTRPYNFSAPMGNSVLPYPHGCHACVPEHMTDQFRKNGCRTLCLMQRYFNHSLDCSDETAAKKGREKCSVPFLAHDAVHPSGVGHQVVTDLIVETVSAARRDRCMFLESNGSNNNGDRNVAVEQDQSNQVTAGLPKLGWMVGSPELLNQQFSFLQVNDTYKMFSNRKPLNAAQHSPGFSLFDDRFGRFGWISENEKGDETIRFDIDLPPNGCYVPYLSILKSYENMGSMTVTVEDYGSRKSHSMDIDSLWEPHISVPNDIQLVPDGLAVCTGHCSVTVHTYPMHANRTGNKIKISTLSVRKCVDSSLLS